MIRFDGMDSDFAYWSVPSFSNDQEYTVVVCSRTGALSCTCMDAQCRQKHDDVLNPNGSGCKHQKLVLGLIAINMRKHND